MIRAAVLILVLFAAGCAGYGSTSDTLFGGHAIPPAYVGNPVADAIDTQTFIQALDSYHPGDFDPGYDY